VAKEAVASSKSGLPPELSLNDGSCVTCTLSVVELNNQLSPLLKASIFLPDFIIPYQIIDA